MGAGDTYVPFSNTDSWPYLCNTYQMCSPYTAVLIYRSLALQRCHESAEFPLRVLVQDKPRERIAAANQGNPF